MLEASGIETQYRSVLGLSHELLKIDSALQDQLKDLRLKLSLEHDQPFVGIESVRS
jgi:hypothetical protein